MKAVNSVITGQKEEQDNSEGDDEVLGGGGSLCIEAYLSDEIKIVPSYFACD